MGFIERIKLALLRKQADKQVNEFMQNFNKMLSQPMQTPAYIEEAAEILKQATEQHKQGYHQEALNLHEKAVKIYEANNDIPLLSILFRKANYLYALNKKEEAWLYLRVLNDKENAGSGDILDKMRLFQQREGNLKLAAVYATMAHLAYAKNSLNRGISEGLNPENPIWPESALAGLLAKMKQPDLQRQITDYLISKQPYLKTLNIAALENELLSQLG